VFVIGHHRNLGGKAAAFRGDRRASAIVEFALIAPIFFLLLFSIIEIGVIFFAQSTLQRAANDVARMIRTGQVQNGALTQAQVTNRVCADIAALMACDGNLKIDVQAFNNFGGVTFTPPLDNNGNYTATNNFSPGAACNVVLVRVFYGWSVFTPVLTPFLSDMSGNKHLLYAASTFRNEPFTSGVNGC